MPLRTLDERLGDRATDKRCCMATTQQQKTSSEAPDAKAYELHERENAGLVNGQCEQPCRAAPHAHHRNPVRQNTTAPSEPAEQKLTEPKGHEPRIREIKAEALPYRGLVCGIWGGRWGARRHDGKQRANVREDIKTKEKHAERNEKLGGRCKRAAFGPKKFCKNC